MPLLVPSKKEPDSTVILKKQTVPPPPEGGFRVAIHFLKNHKGRRLKPLSCLLCTVTLRTES